MGDRQIAQQHGGRGVVRQMGGDGAFGFTRSARDQPRQARRQGLALQFRHRLGHAGQRRHHAGRIGDHFRRHREPEVEIARVDEQDLAAGQRRFTQAMADQRLFHPWVGADQQGSLDLFQVFQRLPQPWKHRGCALIAEISLAQAMVNVRHAQTARQFLGQIQLFHGRGGRDEEADRFGPMAGDHVLQALGGRFQRGFPLGLNAAEQRLGQPVVAIDAFVAEPVAVGNPGFIDLLVLARHDPLHLTALGMDEDVGAHRIMRRDGGMLHELPGPAAVAGRLGGQRANRAEINDVAGQFRNHAVGHIGADFHVLAAPGRAQLAQPGDLLAEPHATGAMNAAGHVGRDQRPDVLFLDHPLALDELRYAGAVTHRQVLQLALAALIADRTVQRVVDQQELHGAFLRGQRLGRPGVNLHAFHHRRRAGRHRLGRFLDLDQTHPATGGDGQLLVITEAGDRDTRRIGGLDEHRALARLQRDAVDFDVNLFLAHLLPAATVLWVSRLTRPAPHRRPCCACARCNRRIRGGSA